MQPRNLHHSGAQGVILLEGSSAARVAVEWVAQPAGVFDHGACSRGWASYLGGPVCPAGEAIECR